MPPRRTGYFLFASVSAHFSLPPDVLAATSLFIGELLTSGRLTSGQQSAQNRPDVVRESSEHTWPLGLNGGWRIGDLHQRFIDNTFSSRDQARGESLLLDLFQTELAIVLPDNPIALAGGVFKFLAVHDLHCATGVFDDLFPLQNTGCQAHGRSICP